MITGMVIGFWVVMIAVWRLPNLAADQITTALGRRIIAEIPAESHTDC